MKNVFKISFFITIISIVSCTKNSCRTCKDNPNAPGIHVEICDDKITTYSNNTVLAEEKNSNSIPIAVISLEASGYKCN